MTAGPAGITFNTPEELGDDYGRWLIHGPQGSGKTRLASTIAELGPTLFVDFTGEKGVRSFKGASYIDRVTFARPDSITALDDLYWWLADGKHDFTAVVLDSLTAIQKMTMRFLLGHEETAVKEIRRGLAPADMRTWGQALDVMQDTATFWYGLADSGRSKPMHVVMTAQTKTVEDEHSGNITRNPDVQKGALSIVLAAPDYILHTDIEDNPDALGDDSVPAVHHVVRFGASKEFRTKARLPLGMDGKIPSILGRQRPLSLGTLSKLLGIGGTAQAAAVKK